MPFKAKTFRPTVFKLLGGVSEVFPTTEQLTRRSALPFYSGIKLRVMIPPSLQLSRYQPNLVKRLNQDWGQTLSCLRCSEGDFRKALNEGRVTLGHIWAEIYSISLHKVTFELGFGDIEFNENNWVLEEAEASMDYRILIFFSKKYPEEFGGLEYLITGYLNAVIEDQPFPIRKRLDEFIIYRSADFPGRNVKENLLSRLLKCLRGG